PPVAPVAPVATGAAGAAVVAAGHAPSHGAQPQEFLRLIASMAQRLQLELLAEGVQTQADFDLLGPLACRLACGPLFSEPLSAERFAALLARDAQLPTPVAAR
ncbi:MAG: EAL domain-containing protein, partial [Rhodanobacteraceae bacterium]